MDVSYEQLNPHACKTYLLTASGTDEAILIDPVLDHIEDYMQVLEHRSLVLSHVIDTHTHADHISGAAALKDEVDCEYLMHTSAPAKCAGFRADDAFSMKLFGSVRMQILHTPGHTQDSISLVLSDAVFTGDALFLDDGGAGRDDLPGGDPSAHWESLERLKRLPDRLIVFPAHDYRDRTPSSLGRQKKTNPHLSERTKEEFVLYLQDLKLGPADWMKDVLKANYACARDPAAAWIPVDTAACEVKGTLDLGVNDQQVSAAPAAVIRQLMADGSKPLLVDVREPDELRGPLGAIEGVVNFPIGDLSHRLAELEKGRTIVTVCRSGARAHTAAQILKQAGYSSVIVLEGGMLEWNG